MQPRDEGPVAGLVAQSNNAGATPGASSDQMLVTGHSETAEPGLGGRATIKATARGGVHHTGRPDDGGHNELSGQGGDAIGAPMEGATETFADAHGEIRSVESAAGNASAEQFIQGGADTVPWHGPGTGGNAPLGGNQSDEPGYGGAVPMSGEESFRGPFQMDHDDDDSAGDEGAGGRLNSIGLALGELAGSMSSSAGGDELSSHQGGFDDGADVDGHSLSCAGWFETDSGGAHPESSQPCEIPAPCLCDPKYTLEGCLNTQTSDGVVSICEQAVRFGLCPQTETFTCSYAPTATACGDGICDLTEHCANCVSDCGDCANPGNACHGEIAELLEHKIPHPGFRIVPFDDLDEQLSELMRQFEIPGTSVAIMKDNKLVYARGHGFGWVRKTAEHDAEASNSSFNRVYGDSVEADRVNSWVHPESLFRVCSISKSITAAAVLRLSDDLDSGQTLPPGVTLCNGPGPCIGLVDHLPFAAGGVLADMVPLSRFRGSQAGPIHPHFKTMKVKHFLNHTSGISQDCGDNCIRMMKDRELAMDLAQSAGLGGLPTVTELVRYAIARPAKHLVQGSRNTRLGYEAGEVYEYSNLGYAILALVIEALSGDDYESFVQGYLLNPVAALDMHLGDTLIQDRRANEVGYYVHPHRRLYRTWFPDDTAPQVSYPDGGVLVDWYDGSGSWVSTGVDLLRFLSGIDLIGNESPRLEAETVIDHLMSNPCVPKYYDSSNGEYYDYAPCELLDRWYGAGFRIRSTTNANMCTDDNDCPVGQRCENDGRCTGRGLDWYHTGSLNGSRTFLYRRSDGVSWAFLGNSIPPYPSEVAAAGSPWSQRSGDWSWYNVHDYTSAIKEILMNATNDTSQWPDHDLFGQFRLPGPWMEGNAFQAHYMTMSAEDKWTLVIEVRETSQGRLEYRGRFAPKIPGVRHRGHFGKTCQDFKSVHEQYTLDGLELVHMNAIVHEGTRRYQGIWMSPIQGTPVFEAVPGMLPPDGAPGFRP